MPSSLGAAAVVDGRAAQRVDRPVVDDAEHPGAHRAAGAVVARARAPERQERLLHDVLGAARACPSSGRRARTRRRSGARRRPRTRARRRAGRAASGPRRRVSADLAPSTAASYQAPSRIAAGSACDVVGRRAAPRARRRAACARRGRARRAPAARRLCRWRARAQHDEAGRGAVPTTTAAAGPTRRAASCAGRLHRASAPTPRARRRPARRASRASSPAAPRGPPAGRPARAPARSSASKSRTWLAHRAQSPASALDQLLELPDRAVHQHLGRAVGAAQRPRDLAVVHAQREAHDQRLAAVVRQLLHALEDPR